MASRVSIRPRLLAISLVTALVVSVLGAWVLTQVASDNGSASSDDAILDRSTAGDPFPDVEVVDVDDEVLRTGSLVGQPLVVNLWYSACAPCVREMPELEKAHAELGDRARFVGINPLDDVDRMLDFADRTGVTYELYRDVNNGEFAEAARVIGYPTTIFVDSDGTVVRHLTREVDADDVREILEGMM